MAKVPQAQPVGALGLVQPTVGPTVFDSTRASAAFGARPNQIGQALLSVGGQVVNMAIQNQEDDNQRALDEALIQFNQQKNDIGFGDGSQQNPGFYSLNGDSAVQSDASTRESLLAAQGEIGEGLTNDRVRQQFLLQTAELTSNELARYSRHTNEQRENARTALHEATIVEAQQDATLNYNDNLLLANDFFNASQAAMKEAIARGEGPEAVASAGEAAESGVAKKAIIGAITASDITKAQELFDEFTEKDENGKTILEGDDLISIKKMLQTSVDLEVAQEAADVVMVLSTNPDGTIDIDKATGLLRETPGLKGKPLQDALNQLGIRVNEQEAIKDQRMSTSESALNTHLAGGGDINEWTSQNAELWEELQSDSATANRIQAYREIQARGQQFAQLSDGVSWSRLHLSKDKPLEEVNLETYRGVLTENEYNRLVSAQGAALGQGANGQTNSQVRAVHENARSIMFRLAQSIPAFNDEDTEDQLKNDVRVAIEREMGAFVQTFTNQGKEPSNSEIQKEASRIIMNVQTGQSGIFGGSFLAGDNFFEGIAAQKPRLTIEQQGSAIVPTAMMTELQLVEWTSIYNRVGIQPTESMLEQLGGAIAMDDATRVIRLLTPRVKASE